MKPLQRLGLWRGQLGTGELIGMQMRYLLISSYLLIYVPIIGVVTTLRLLHDLIGDAVLRLVGY